MHCEHHMASAGHVADFGSCVQYSFNNNQIGYWILVVLAQYWLLAMLYWEPKFGEKTVSKPVVYKCNTSVHTSRTQHFTC